MQEKDVRAGLDRSNNDLLNGEDNELGWIGLCKQMFFLIKRNLHRHEDIKNE
jgi:hypothetical protein